MKKNLRRIVTFVLAVALVFAMSVPALADSGSVTQNYYSGTAAYYQQSAASTFETSDAVEVTLDIQSQKVDGSYFTAVLPVSFPETTSVRTISVTDVLVRAAEMYNSLSFQNTAGNDLVAGSSYLHQVVYGSYTFAASTNISTRQGWMFRINSRIPLLSGTPGTSSAWGAAINQAYVDDGDVISLYMDVAKNSNTAAWFTRVKTASYVPGATDEANGTFSAYIECARSYFDTSNIWHIDPFEECGGVTVGVYDSQTATTALASGTTGSSGTVSLNVHLTPGTYYIRVAPLYSGNNILATDSIEVITVPVASN